jgi:spore maturation protein CgeB
MNILYYFWNENCKEDCVESMKRLGHNVEVWKRDFKNYSEDSDFEYALQETVNKSSVDCIFSFDYFPLISKVSQIRGLPYISWIYDCPHYTLQSDTLNNSCNHVYVFDYALAERYRTEGFKTVDYMPLPVNTNRLRNLLGKRNKNYSHDISFVGSLYNDDHNYFDQISYLPEYVRGYLDSVIKVQELIYGMDVPSLLISGEIYDEIEKYVIADLGKGFRSIKKDFICDMLRKKVTVNERRNLLTLLGNRFNLDLFSGSKPAKDINVNYKGIADYYSEMPYIFASSKININISLRSILTGIPLRVVDIIGAGGFCLTNYQAEMSEYFENGRELVWFESPGDMVEKADYFLHHDDEREKIAINGAEAAERIFSYDVLLPKVLDIF